MKSTALPAAEPLIRIQSTLGEGALWDSRAQLLYWVDIMEGRVYLYDPRTNTNREVSVGHHVGTVVPRASGGLAIAIPSGFASLDPVTGVLGTLAVVTHPTPGLRFNDGKCDPQGRFWAGTMAYDCAPGAGSLYVLDAQHQVRRVVTSITISNGLVWNRDGTMMFYIDSMARRVDRFTVDPDTGTISERRAAVDIPAASGIPDGMAIDEAGMLWVALHDSGTIGRFDPTTGRQIHSINIPGAKLVTSCAFGGPRLDTLYITTASIGMTDEQKRQQPLAGCLFVANPGVCGVPAHAYLG